MVITDILEQHRQHLAAFTEAHGDVIASLEEEVGERAYRLVDLFWDNLEALRQGLTADVRREHPGCDADAAYDAIVDGLGNRYFQ